MKVKKLVIKKACVLGISLVMICSASFITQIQKTYAINKVENNPVLDITKGNIEITDKGYKVGSDEEVPYIGEYEITGTTTTNHVIVKSGKHDIVVNNLSINQATPFVIEGSSTVTMILKNKNKFVATQGDKAAIYVQENANLIIDGDDTSFLEAQGGNSINSKAGSGIGANFDDNSGNITIHGGNITAIGGNAPGHYSYDSSAIGGGCHVLSGNILITGGKISVTSRFASPIGNGGKVVNGSTASITITGGTIIDNSTTMRNHVYFLGVGQNRVSSTPMPVIITGGNLSSSRELFKEETCQDGDHHQLTYAKNCNIADDSITIKRGTDSKYSNTLTKLSDKGYTLCLSPEIDDYYYTAQDGKDYKIKISAKDNCKIEEVKDTHILVKNKPKTVYEVGESFVPTGLSIDMVDSVSRKKTIAYNDTTKKDFTFSIASPLQMGEKEIEVTYKGFKATLPITVKEFVGISVKQPPKKSKYIEEEYFNPEGLIINKVYNNGDIQEVTYKGHEKDFTFSTSKLLLGKQSIGVTYQGKSTNIALHVAAKQLHSISVKASPQVQYIEGQEFNPKGLIITATHDNGSSIDIYYENDYIDFQFDKTKLTTDDTAININYQGKTTMLPIQVVPVEITKLSVKSLPKVQYFKGETFDPTGLVMTVEYNNGIKEDILYDSHNFDFQFDKTKLTTNDTAICITYQGKTTMLPIQVVPVEITKLSVKSLPKVQYYEGETFDPTGLVMAVEYNNGIKEDILYDSHNNDFQFNKTELKANDTNITITYLDKTIDIKISVLKNTDKKCIPQTGDNTNIMFYWLLVLASLLLCLKN